MTLRPFSLSICFNLPLSNVECWKSLDTGSRPRETNSSFVLRISFNEYIYIYRVIRVELYKLYRVIIFFFRSLFEEGRKIRISFFWKNLHQLLRLNFKDFIANSLIDSFPVSTSRYLFDKFTLSHSYNPLNNTNSREKDKFEINAE